MVSVAVAGSIPPPVATAIDALAAADSRPPRVFRVKGLTLRADFDGGNLAGARLGLDEDGMSEVIEIYIAPDCQGALRLTFLAFAPPSPFTGPDCQAPSTRRTIVCGITLPLGERISASESSSASWTCTR